MNLAEMWRGGTRPGRDGWTCSTCLSVFNTQGGPRRAFALLTLHKILTRHPWQPGDAVTVTYDGYQWTTFTTFTTNPTTFTVTF